MKATEDGISDEEKEAEDDMDDEEEAKTEETNIGFDIGASAPGMT